MNNWKVIFATVVIFGAGVVTGGLLVNYVHYSHPKTIHRPATPAEVHQPATNPAPRVADTPKSPRPPELLSKSFLQQLDDALHLKPDQHEAIEKIMSDGQNQMRKAIQDARLEIREVLTVEQRKQFDELMKRPFRKALFGTNAPSAAESDFKARLEKIIAAQRFGTEDAMPTPPGSPVRNYPGATNLSPEAQVLLIEAQRAKFQAAPSNALPPPPPAFTNAP